MTLHELNYGDQEINTVKIFFALLNYIGENTDSFNREDTADDRVVTAGKVKVHMLLKMIGYSNRGKTQIDVLGEKLKELITLYFLEDFQSKESSRESFKIFRKVRYEDSYISFEVFKEYFNIEKLFFPLYKLNQLLKLNSKYSFRLYQIVYSNKASSKWILHLNVLKKWLGLDAVENKQVKREIVKAVKEITDKTDIALELVEKYKQTTTFDINIKKKSFEYEEIRTIEDAIEVACKNRYIEEKKLKEKNAFKSGIYKAVKRYSEDIVRKTLFELEKNTNNEIKNTFEAYLMGACKNKKNEIMEKEKKQEKIIENMKIEKIKQEESENEAKLNDEKIARYCEKYGKLTSEEQEEITKGAEELYLKKMNVENFTKVTKEIFERTKKSLIAEVMEKRA